MKSNFLIVLKVNLIYGPKRAIRRSRHHRAATTVREHWQQQLMMLVSGRPSPRLLEQRSLTNKIIEEEFDWANEFLKDATPDGTNAKAQFLVAFGGAYDLMFQGHNAGEKLSARRVQLAAMLAFWMPMGLSVDEICASVRKAQELTGIS